MIRILVALLVCTFPAPPQEGDAITDAEMRFEGNHFLSTGELLRAATDEMVDFEKRGYRRIEVDDAAFQMESSYRELGFPKATVSYRYEVESRKALVTFVVHEGPRTRIDRITVTGNRALSTEEIKSFFGEPQGGIVERTAVYFVEEIVRAAPRSIAAAYRIRGYLDVVISKPKVEFSQDNKRALITIDIEEGPRHVITMVSFEGNRSFSKGRLRASIADFMRTPFYPRRAFEVASRIEEFYGEAGYADVHVTIRRDTGGAQSDVHLHLSVKEGPRVTIRTISVLGNEKTRKTFVLSRLSLHPGQTYRRSLLRESFLKLYQTGLFESVKLTLTGKGRERDLTVELEEADSLEVSLLAGYGSYERVRGGLGFREKNIFGTGRQFRAETEASLVGHSVLVGLTDPWLLGSDYTLDVPVFVRRRVEPSFTRSETGVSLVLGREWTDAFSTSLSYQFRNTQVTTSNVETNLDITGEKLRIASLALEPRYDTRNDPFNPTAGHRVSLSIEYGDIPLGSAVTFWRARLDAAQFLSLGEDTVLAANARTGFVLPLRGTDEIPLQLRFFNGGESSVRSFKESELGPKDADGDPIGGEVRNIFSIELRQRLTGNLHGALFFDYGNVGLEIKDYFDGFSPALGAGLRYLLPIGAIRLDAGFNTNQRADDDGWALHLSVGMAF